MKSDMFNYSLGLVLYSFAGLVKPDIEWWFLFGVAFLIMSFALFAEGRK